MRSTKKRSFKKPKPKVRSKHRSGWSNAFNNQRAQTGGLAAVDMELEKLCLGSFKSYVMSDPDDSDSNMSGDDSDHPGDKKFPDWARKGVYSKLEERQRNVNPDTIFGSYVNQTIDLCELYKKLPTKKRYVRRNPSGDWSLDKLTQEEDVKYKAEKGWLPATPPVQVK